MTPEDIFNEIGGSPVFTPHSTKGFHGTQEDDAGDILKNGFDFSKCRPGLFGRGAYFYEEVPHPGPTAATCFIRKWKPAPRIAVIVATLSIEHAFDLLGVEENMDFFTRIQKKLVDMAIQAGATSSLDERTIGTATVEFIVRYYSSARKMQAIRATFRMPDLSPPRQHGACVRDSDCISILEKISISTN